MKLEMLGKIKNGRQDGAIYGGFIFSFDHLGRCSVYRTESLRQKQDGEVEVFSEFVLDKNEILMPHSNAVMFGTEFYAETDEFPLLYTNIYNNYAKAENPLHGVCLVYRVQRNGAEFQTTLVQMIEIGFTEDETLWKSAGETKDVRPYGNFAVDTENNVLYAFVMRDQTHSTRYFAFDLPKAAQGETDAVYGVKKVVLQKDDIRDFFDCDYHNYIQGACCRNGKIYSLEGFGESHGIPPAIRIIDIKTQCELCYKRFKELGLDAEPELIDFENGICYYSENSGKMFRLDLEPELL